MPGPLMLFTLAIFLPPVSVWCGERNRVAVLINVGLCLLGWLPGVIHAMMLTNRLFYRQRLQ